jgi:hypothetical protein
MLDDISRLGRPGLAQVHVFRIERPIATNDPMPWLFIDQKGLG